MRYNGGYIERTYSSEMHIDVFVGVRSQYLGFALK